MTYYIGKPNILDRDKFISRVNEVLDAGVLTNNGKMVQELEGAIASYHGVEHAIAFCNASLALELVLSTIPPGEVILPTFTFIATAQAVRRAGHKPVFVDIGSKNFDINCDQVLEKITPQTVAIVPVNLFGHICDLERLKAISDEKSINLIYDSAHGLGINAIGAHGLCEVFSLHATKLCNSVEGGVVTTNDDELAKKLRSIRNFGYAAEAGLPPEGIFRNPYLATNAKMSEIHAAMGITNFEKIDEIKSHYKMVYDAYSKHLPGEVSLYEPNCDFSTYSYITVKTAKRDSLYKHLRSKEIYVRAYFSYLCSDIMGAPGAFGTARTLMNNIMCLPTGMSITEDDVKIICREISSVN